MLLKKNKRISFYRSILQLKPTFYQLNSVKRSVKNNKNINFFPKHYKLHFKWFLDMNYCYDVTFSNNILVLGEIGYGKTSFVQNLGKKKFLGEGLLRVDWVSRIDLSKEREDQIRQCFNYAVVEIHYSDDVDDLNLIIERFQKETHDNVENNNNNCNIFGENKNLTNLLLWTTSQVLQTNLAILQIF